MRRDVVVVDEDEAAGQSLVAMLAAHGHRAVWARGDGEAESMLAREAPCLVLIGRLPPPRLRALVRCLRRQHRAIPAVILSTSSVQSGDAAPATGQGAYGLPAVARPVDAEALLRVVDRFCGAAAPVRAVVN